MNTESRFKQFYEKQPPLLFVDELKSPVHTTAPDWFKREVFDDTEVLAKGAYIVDNFCDAEGLLETAFDDFNLFLDIYKIKGNSFPIYIQKEKTDCFEAYTIKIEKERCTLSANDTEGIRRGLVYLEDEFLRREGPILPLGKITRAPRIKKRITRGFFSPTNRPPLNIDELSNDIDYYPDEYLNRLAHDGTNGLWIYTRLSDLVKTDIIPEYGDGCEKRIAKLNSIIKRCKRYGIGVYVFMIDPIALPAELYEKYPHMAGIYQPSNNTYTFCTSSEEGARYCVEAMQKLCKALPDMAGVIDITNGEKPTSCASNKLPGIMDIDDGKGTIAKRNAHNLDDCPRCKGKSRAEVVAHTANLLREGMRKANSNAEFISWTYGHKFWGYDEIESYIEKVDSDIIIMQNFEEKGTATQLGKKRLAIDYWLSYAGPSDLYKISSEAAKKNGNEMYAKMQVCCSHELATVPYIPVPGILFDKYSADISGVMQCWYFGNYPSLMSKASGELAFMHDFSDKKAFLEHLAGIYFGNSRAKEASKAWELFEKGYKNYPLNILFSYYGPVHDGIAWDLQLKPKNYPLSRSWKYLEAAEGDRIGECIFNCHTIEETEALLDAITENWEKGLSFLPSNTPDEQKSVAEALMLLFTSAKNIIEFYMLRYELAKNNSDARDTLTKMRKIVEDEIENSKKMIPLCENDSRLGYHSEAESYKFFPAQLKKRITSLSTLLKTEFAEVEKRIDDGLFALEYFLGDENGYKMAKSLDCAKAEEIEGANAFFKVAYDRENIYMLLDGEKDSTFDCCFEFLPLWPSAQIKFEKGERSLISHGIHGYFGEKVQIEKGKYAYKFTGGKRDIYTITISRKDVSWIEDMPLKLRIANNSVLWKKSENPVSFLHIYRSPDEFGWLMP
ncbi:MAG: hypothetical protein E7410_06440 [Ruminococcaceae bacterium]|nr:hypothetical protein [Oscillospiraceae bacterium]